MRTTTLVLLLAFFCSCSTAKLSQLNDLVGTWKVADKEQYEVWEKGPGVFTGYAYRIKDGRKERSETLSIKKIGKQLIYAATVPDQNDGRTILFTLNEDIKDYWSFENPNHDFPKRIQYKKLNPTKIQVTVLGDNGRGFSYVQTKQR